MGTRDLLRWPLHSLRRLLLTLAVIAAAVVGLALLVNSPKGEGDPTATSEARPPAASSAPAPRPSPSSTPSLPTARDYDRAIETARAFVTAWASHPTGWRTWYAGAARHTTDRLAAKLASVDPGNVAATKVSGRLRLTDTGASGRTEVAVPTDEGTVSVTLLEDGAGRWRVDDVQPGAQAVN
ncbi:hypothetical protein [Streptomyces sp. NPDC017940]|uniref:hypothetical protein n=1 Tax=Streptomyces sp. NPDC017940 TaxID=3365017 RepID=UPI00379F1AD0